jgi:PAS domain S-box-containing protein
VRDAFLAGATDCVTNSEVQDDPDLLKQRILTAIENSPTKRNHPRQSGSNTEWEIRLAALFEEFPAPIIHVAFVDGDTIVRDLNPAFEETFGFDATALTDQSVGVLQFSSTGPQSSTCAPTTQAEQTDAKVTRMTVDGPRTFRFLTIPVTTRCRTTEVYGVYIETRDSTVSDPNTAPSREFLDQTLTATNTGVGVLDVETDRFHWHESTAQLFGYPSDDFQTAVADFLQHVHPADRSLVEAEINAAGDETMFDIEFRVQQPDDSYRWVRGRGTMPSRLDNSADPVIVVTDISTYKEQEAELIRYENIIEAAGDPVFALDSDCRFTFVNDAFVDVTGYSRAEILGTDISLLLDEADVRDVRKIGRALAQRSLERGVHECEIRTGYETCTRVELSFTSLPGEEFDRTVGIARNIEERKQQEQQLERQRDRFAALFDAVPEPAVRVRFENEEPIVRQINDAFVDVFGYMSEEAVGKSLNSLIVPPEEVDSAQEIDQNAVDGNAVTRQVQRETIWGTREFLFRSAPIESETDAPEQFGVYVDITEQSERKQRLEQQRDNLDILNRVMRHDIRNNLQAVIGYAETIEAKSEGADRDHATRIRENAEHAADLTRTARELADVMLRSEVDREPMSLPDVLQSQVDQIQSRYPAAVIRVDSDMLDVAVLADELLESVARNLLENAIQHNDKEVPEVTVSVTVDTNWVEIRIADNGPGISDSRKDEIFGKGEKGLESDGTGIGLYLVSTLVEQYGGDIRVDDNDPTGSVFVVRLSRTN